MTTRAPAKRARPSKSDPIAVQLISDGFEARDISVTGAGIFVPTHLEGCALRSPVKLIIGLPEVEPFRARGRIVHRTKMDREVLGVEFIGLPPAQAAMIARYVERRLSESQPSRRTEPMHSRRA